MFFCMYSEFVLAAKAAPSTPGWSESMIFFLANHHTRDVDSSTCMYMQLGHRRHFVVDCTLSTTGINLVKCEYVH